MRTVSLDKNWRMKRPADREYLTCGNLPVSVYQTLLDNNKIDNPYYGENEFPSRDICRDDYDFKTKFSIEGGLLSHEKVFLQLDGIDTISDIYLNNMYVGSTDNMFRTYCFDIKDKLTEGDNKLKISIKSPILYMEKKYAQRPIYGMDTNICGYQHLRKPHCMSGWDWGPQLPDMGIWKTVKLIGVSTARIDSISVLQDYNADYSALALTVCADFEHFSSAPITAEAEIALSDGRVLKGVMTSGKAVFKLANPELWYPRGYGRQPLNKITVRLFSGDKLLDCASETVGFRDMTVHRDDEKGIFCINCNGIDIFSMGANVIPLDQIFPYITKSRIHDFLGRCLEENFNMVRIWGGGYYADEVLLEECDRLGIMVWQDFAFACSAYRLDEAFENTIRAEFEDNIKRMRNHACLALWCGNNEIESMWEGWGVPEDDETRTDYIRIFEEIIPETLKKLDPQRFYWPSSPSIGGNQYGTDGVFHNSSDNHRGDQHYWDIWHNFKPIEDFRKYLFPFCSEYGFEAVPNIKTIRSFAEESDLNLCSPVMELHQKCTAGNEKLLYYIAQMCRYPYSFEKLIYASQLVQSDCIRSNVEHLRRNRGTCMGSLYWQINDSNPVISWSSIDYFNRPKALHYAAGKFYAPVLLSCLEEDASAVILNISNETTENVRGTISWRLRSSDSAVLTEGTIAADVPPLSAMNAAPLNFADYFRTEQDKRTNYLEYSLTEKGKILSKGTTIFVRPKKFCFIDPKIDVHINEKYERFEITLTSKAFAKAVYLDLEDADCEFSDNWFDLNANEPKCITISRKTLSEDMDSAQLYARLKVMSCFDLQ